MSSTAFDFGDGWFDPDEFARLRRRMPITYVNAVPVRLGADGAVQQIGLLLRSDSRGNLTRELVSGRVRYHESLREALIRHAENDLGPMALPQVPPSLQPFTVAEYFPTPGTGRLHDPRQHAIALCYVLPVRGECSPRQDALSLDWLTPTEALMPDIVSEMSLGQVHLLKQALAHLGQLP
ncbi:DUF4916 domain-containing protein [Naumannella halotolerans]|nr:DUF4916 domain-containing protein [Naumannella halotolerans]